MIRFLTLFSVALLFSGLTAQAAEAPDFAASVGYHQNTFSMDQFNSETVDSTASYAPGYRLYADAWLASRGINSQSIVKKNTDGSITFTGANGTSNASFMTGMVNSTNRQQFVGTAFGGGFYLEAEIKFNPEDVMRVNPTINSALGWPSLWMGSVEGLTLNAMWPGQAPNYQHTTEIDIMEYMQRPQDPVNIYGAGIHEWSGVWQQTCAPSAFCHVSTSVYRDVMRVPAEVKLNNYNRYGVLWVPATDTTQGYIQYYFNRQPISMKYSWTKYTDQPPAPGMQPWTFGVTDQHHWFLIFGTGTGMPMDVRAINVWQKNDSNNIRTFPQYNDEKKFASCGAASQTPTTDRPVGALCSVGTAGKLSFDQSSMAWNWTCTTAGTVKAVSRSSKITDTDSAESKTNSKLAQCQAPVTVHGQCGKPPGTTAALKQKDNLCLAGNLTGFSASKDKGSRWSCDGINGGEGASCEILPPRSVSELFKFDVTNAISSVDTRSNNVAVPYGSPVVLAWSAVTPQITDRLSSKTLSGLAGNSYCVMAAQGDHTKTAMVTRVPPVGSLNVRALGTQVYKLTCPVQMDNGRVRNLNKVIQITAQKPTSKAIAREEAILKK